MTAHALAQFAPRVLIHLADPALRSIVLACFAALMLGVLRVRHASVQLAVWTGVLYAAMAMPLLALLAAAIPVPLRIPARRAAEATPIMISEPTGKQFQIAPEESASRSNPNSETGPKWCAPRPSSVKPGADRRSAWGATSATAVIGPDQAAALPVTSSEPRTDATGGTATTRKPS